MNYLKSYTSFSCSPFDVWRIFFYGLVILSFIIGIATTNIGSALIYSLIVILVITAAFIVTSYSEVELSGRRLMLNNLNKTIHLNKIETVETWWSYEFGISTIDVSDPLGSKTRGHNNKINIFAKFVSPEGEAYIFEEIHLGDKFPNNHPYIADEPIDESRIVKVWDVDKCLEKLGIDG